MNLSYSKLKTFKTCPRKFKYAYLERITRIEEAKEDHHSAWGIVNEEIK